jgi:CubicO group peptidase (beta-lactamase class C family)
MRIVHLILTLLCCITLSAKAAEVRPLAEAAETFSKKLPKGVIVTGESNAGEVRYSITGKLNLPDVAPEQIIFEIGSLTKVFTGLLLAQTVVEGKATLDMTLQEALGDAVTFEDPQVGRITLRQLATHTSSLPRLPDNMELGADPQDPYAHYDRARLFSYLAKARLKGQPPFAKSYSNLGMGLLGEVLSHRYGQSWIQLIEEKITRPLGMHDTTVVLNEEQRKRLAPPLDGEQTVKPWNLASMAGAGALRSTAADLMLFGETLLHSEKTPLKEAIALLLQPQEPAEIGLAIGLGKFYGQRTHEHNGGTGGYRTVFQILPDSQTVRVVLTNNAALPAEAVLAAVQKERAPAPIAEKALPEEELSRYEGVYPIDTTTRFTVLRRGDQLMVQLTGQGFLQLHARDVADRFFFKEVQAEIQFHREKDEVVGLTLFQNGREVAAKKGKDPLPKVIFRTPQELKEYAGKYELTPAAIFTIQVVHGTLYAQLTGQPFLPVIERRRDWFEYDTVAAALEFQRDEKGKVVALQLHQHGLVQRAVRKP